jgi:pantoate--beta-alanine ligase
MIQVVTAQELAAAISPARDAGKRIAFVPTMGALHAGHISLIALAKQHADFVVVSIFVNPLQFAAGEDFENYPRTIEEDAQKLAIAEVDVLWVPTVNDVYAGNTEITQNSGSIGLLYEGAARPNHFDGMLTVVAKLFDRVKPDIAVFGRKDAQQVFLVKQMVKRSFPNIRVIEANTLREPTGLAMSSRNSYLSEDEKHSAEIIAASLSTGKAAAGDVDAVIQAASEALAKEPKAKLDYIALVDADTFEPVTNGFKGPALLLIAVVIGKTRLIDNIEVNF